MARILIVDDEASICWALRAIVEAAGHEALVAATARRAREIVREASPDALFLDVRLPDGDGIDLLLELRKERPHLRVVVITGHGGLETAVRAVQAGAADYLVKPLDLEGARRVLARAVERAPIPGGPRGEEAGGAPGSAPPRAAPDPFDLSTLLVGRSPAMQEVYKRIAAVAATDTAVLIEGENGTGKELIARAIHGASGRRAGPFEPIDCAALPHDLVESELYGHERGAFTGAHGPREGRIRRADGGTVLLDEIGELPREAQAKLLRFLAEREVTPVGGSGRVRVDVRVLAATNRPLEKAVRDGRFREDLFYRLQVFTIHAPPLRERKADIPDLVARFVARAGPRGEGATAAAPETLARLAAHDWPGNVRELRNAVEHALVLARGPWLLPEHLPAYLQAPERTGVAGKGLPEALVAPAAPSVAPGAQAREIAPEGPLRVTAGEAKGPAGSGVGALDLRPLAARLLDEAAAEGASSAARHALDRLERALVETAIQRAQGSVSGVARLLGWTRTTARKRMRELGFDAQPADEDGPEA